MRALQSVTSARMLRFVLLFGLGCGIAAGQFAVSITSVSPASIARGSLDTTLTITGTGFLSGSTAGCPPSIAAPPSFQLFWSFGGSEQQLTPSTATDTQIVVTVPANLLTVAGTAALQVRVLNGCTPPNYVPNYTRLSNWYDVSITAPVLLTVSCNNPPNAVINRSYSHQLAASGGTAPYTWAPVTIASGVQLGTNGVITGAFQPGAASVYSFTTFARDARQMASAPIRCSIYLAPDITDWKPRTATACGPAFTLDVTGTGFQPTSVLGLGPVEALQPLATTFKTATNITGAVPASLIQTAGTPSLAAGNLKNEVEYIFSEPRTFTVRPAPSIVGITPANAPAGSDSVSVTVAGANFVSGVTKVYWQRAGAARVALASTSGTATSLVVTVPKDLIATTGAAVLRVVNVEDANPEGTAYAEACSRTATFTIGPPTLQITTATLPDGTVGVRYPDVTLAASGGAGSLTWRITAGSVPGLALSTSGVFGGTPTTANTYTITVQVSDSAVPPQSKTRDFTVKINPPALRITGPANTTLPDGATNAAYPPVTFTADGGAGAGSYRWDLASAAVPGLTLTQAGVLQGTPTTANPYTLTVRVTDGAQTVTRDYTLTVNAGLRILTPADIALPSGIAWTDYTQITFTAQNASGECTWAIESGEVPGLTLTAAGVLQGKPSAPGSYTVAVRVTDAAGTVARRSYDLTVEMPPAPQLSLVAAAPPAQLTDQTKVTLTLTNTYPVPLDVWLGMTYSSNAAGLPTGYWDPALKLSATQVQVDAQKRSVEVNLQLGTTAGSATVRVETVQVAGSTIAVTPQAQTATFTINREVPRIVPNSVYISRTGGGFTVELDGYSTPRDLKSARFTFAAASGTRLDGNTTFDTDLGPKSVEWFGGAGTAHGSRFHLSVPFTLGGDASALGSVAVTLENSVGRSNQETGGVR